LSGSFAALRMTLQEESRKLKTIQMRLSPVLGGGRVVRFDAGVVVHLCGPQEEAPHLSILMQHDSDDLRKSDFLHLHSGVGLKTPLDVGTAPGREAMAASCIPDKSDDVPHGLSLQVSRFQRFQSFKVKVKSKNQTKINYPEEVGFQFLWRIAGRWLRHRRGAALGLRFRLRS